MFTGEPPATLDYGESHGAAMPRIVAFEHGMAAPDAENWGEGGASAPATVSVQIGRNFAGAGDAPTLRRMYDRATLFALLGTIVLALLALLMICTAAAIVIYAPADRHDLLPWITLPPTIVSFGLGGFAMFRLGVSSTGVSVQGSPEPTREHIDMVIRKKGLLF